MKYVTANQAAQMTNRAIQEQITKQTDEIFSNINSAIKNRQFSIKYFPEDEELYPEVCATLVQYGYGVVCPQDGGKCWEISWNSDNRATERHSNDNIY